MKMRTDQDYIRKGVELADGFEIADAWIWKIYGTPQHFRPANQPPQYLLDALAAQLVRQVDALAEVSVEVFQGWSAVRDAEPPTISRFDLAAAYGPDRTMNTIKAIVDSKVLEGDG